MKNFTLEEETSYVTASGQQLIYGSAVLSLKIQDRLGGDSSTMKKKERVLHGRSSKLWLSSSTREQL